MPRGRSSFAGSGYFPVGPLPMKDEAERRETGLRRLKHKSLFWLCLILWINFAEVPGNLHQSMWR